MKFLANSKTDNHLKTLTEKLEQYDEALFAVAFLKVSGLTRLILTLKKFLKSGKRISIIAGQSFALTQPEALHTLRKLFQIYPTSKIYLAKANSVISVFHPKLYLFKSRIDCCIISGSANITEGGLINNKETSLISICKDTDEIWKEANGYFNSLLCSDNANEATLLVIKQYETFYEQQKHYNKKAKVIPTKTKSQIAFDYHNLLKHFLKFDNVKRQERFKNKLLNYKDAKEVLNEIADNTKLTQKQFEPLLDRLVGSKEEYSLWHSGSLFRLRRSVYPFFKEFRDLVRYIRENKSLPASVVFKYAKEKVKLIDGAAVNYITEIMMTYNYIDFANMNRNPITVLKQEGGVNIKAHSSSFKEFDYEEYCELIKEISSELGIRNMLEADTFFNEIYWKIK